MSIHNSTKQTDKQEKDSNPVTINKPDKKKKYKKIKKTENNSIEVKNEQDKCDSKIIKKMVDISTTDIIEPEANKKAKKKRKNKKNNSKCELKDISIANISKDDLLTKLEYIMTNCDYVKKCKSNKKKDINSLSYLINIPLVKCDCEKPFTLSHSDCIKLGQGVEHILNHFITLFSGLENIKEKFTKKGGKEKDHLFKDEKNKRIIYAEIKGNINLDTEKSPATYNKCRAIEEELKNTYTDYDVKMYLVNVRYYTKDIIPTDMKKKYKSIKDNLLGVNEYLNILSLTEQFTDENEYSIFMNSLSKKMFKY
jgi:hypothetical protein